MPFENFDEATNEGTDISDNESMAEGEKVDRRFWSIKNNRAIR